MNLPELSVDRCGFWEPMRLCFTRFLNGKQLMRKWFMEPLYDLELIVSRLDLVDWVVKTALAESIQDCLKNSHDISVLKI